MSGRPVFGDFVDAARGHLGTAGRLRRTAGRDVDIPHVNRSLLRVITVMRRCVQDVTPGWVPAPPRGRRVLTGWARAGAESREALSNAVGFTERAGHGQPTAAWGRFGPGSFTRLTHEGGHGEIDQVPDDRCPLHDAGA
jgi:hypothetical protein